MFLLFSIPPGSEDDEDDLELLLSSTPSALLLGVVTGDAGSVPRRSGDNDDVVAQSSKPTR